MNEPRNRPRRPEDGELAERPVINRGLAALFEAQARERPDAVAVVFADQQLSYHELNLRADCLAQQLRSWGVGPEVPVALSLERSFETALGLLAILKAGGAYLPLDPDLPKERLAFLLADAGSPAGRLPLLLTQSRLCERIPHQGQQAVCLDTTTFAPPAVEPREMALDPAHLAYIIYTSGSTGRPKGVAMSQGALINLVDWQVARSTVAQPRTLQFAALSFDVSCQEMFSTWAAGGTLILVPEEVRRDFGLLLDQIANERIERLFLPFIALEALAQVAEARGSVPRSVQEVLCAGEQLRTSPSIRAFCRQSGAVLENQYGPSETHVVSAARLPPQPSTWPDLPAIGQAISNTQIYVADHRLLGVEAGLPGELLLGGAGLARAYLGQPRWTAERFVPDPFSHQPGTRLYRSGDLGRLHDDGHLEFLGRLDHQLKLRGHRIEPGEIETVLAQHGGVKSCVVAARERHGGEKILLAWVVQQDVTQDSAEATPEVLRRHLEAKLPEYMIPTAFVFLDAFPLLPSGKVDRRALPAPQFGRHSVREPFVAPRSVEEKTLAQIWCAVLGLDQVGIHDNFFALGGHSLLATQVLTRLRSISGREVPLRWLFASPTVAWLAERLEDEPPRQRKLPPLVPSHQDGPRPLSFAQERLWFLDRLVPDNPFYNAPIFWTLRGPLDVSVLAASLRHVVRRHEVLRTRYPAQDGQPVQVIEADSPGDKLSALALPRIDLRSLGEGQRRAEAERLAGAEARRPFHLESGPVLRATLVHLTAEETIFLLTVHHIATDGWSYGVLLRELSAVFEAFALGRPSPLEELAVQYADFAVWQRGWLRGAVLAEQTAWWRRQLDGAPTLDLPTDRPRLPVQAFNGRRFEFRLPPSLILELEGLSQSRGATLFMTLFAAWNLLLHRISGQGDLVVGSPIAGRGVAEIETLVGFFVNMLALRSDFADDPPFTTAIDRACTTSVAAFEHQDLPFEKLVEELRLRRDTSRNPLFQVALALQNAPRTALTAAGLAICPLPFETRTTRFDIELHLVDAPNGGLHGIAYFDHDLFDTTTIQRWHRAWHRVLEAVAAEPGQRASEVALLTAPERAQLVLETNDTAHPPQPLGALHPEHVHQLFAAYARLHPSALAASDGDGELHYGALDCRANALAHRLRSCGVGPDVLVALHLRRGIRFLWAALGVLKAGGAYLPLDPSHPEPRRCFMLEDAGSRVVLCEGLLPPGLAGEERHVLDLDAWERQALGADVNGGQGAACGATAAPAVAVDGENLAYVLYTSGSTGQPKGVEVRHHGLSNLVTWWRDRFDLRPGERVGQVSTLVFDAAGIEIWPCLTAGGSLYFAPDRARAAAPEMLAWIAAQGIQHCWLPTPLMELAGGESWPRGVRLKALQTGGDKLHGRGLERLPKAIWECFENVYGPTEVTVVATSSRVQRGVSTPPIGKPIGGDTVYLFDHRLRPVVRGARGEILLGGAGLARGYRQRPALTARSFVPHPFPGGEPGARLYRTGDLGRLLADGEIECLGRIDQQVKVRGHRIELGEIEAALRHHRWVRSAVVTCQPSAGRHSTDQHSAGEHSAGEQRLVAYVVPATDHLEPPQSEFQQERVEEWELVFEELYARPAPPGDAAFNTIGWDDTATGVPLSAEAMRQWLDDTLHRIRAFGAQRILEIGCGTGMILFPIAPTCEFYLGTDIAQPALDTIEAQRPLFGGLPQVRLAQGAATDELPQDLGKGLGQASHRFDLVIINSVAQYFASAAYLTEVIEGAVRRLAPGGALFLGDLRSRPLALGFHALVELTRAQEEDLVAEVTQRARLGLLEETELIIDPAFFFRLRQRLPRIARVEIVLKRGTAHNELTSFRYQAILHIAGQDESGVGVLHQASENPTEWLDWQRGGLSLAALRHLLGAWHTPPAWAIHNLPNARVHRALEVLEPASQQLTAGALRHRHAEQPPAGVEPQDLWDLGEELGWEVELSWARHDDQGRFDLLLRRRGSAAPWPTPTPPDFDPAQPLAHFTNRPGLAQRLVRTLRQALAAQLPEYMMPAAWMLLPALPLTSRGKVDRRALPTPRGKSGSSHTTYVAPTTEVEHTLQGIWQELLDATQVGVEDDFFELGGHSLLATQLVSRLRQAFAVDLPLRTLFEAPTIAALGKHLAHHLVADGAKGDRSGVPTITRSTSTGTPPLSFAQERLWFLDRLVPDNPFYNSPIFWTLRGAVDVHVLAASLHEIVRRHEVLRTSFPARSGQPVQVIAPLVSSAESPATMPPRIDLRRLGAACRRAEVERLAYAEARHPFRLESGPVWRATLVHLAAEETVLLLTIHHIATDGWSYGVLLRELSTLLEAFGRGRPSPLGELEIQYADFAVWQRGWLRGEVLRRQLEWWRQRLDGAPTLDLPTDRPRLPVQAFRGRRLEFVLTPTLTAALEDLSRSRGATLFMTLFAAWNALLHRLSGQVDLVVGSPIAGRGVAEVEGLVGFFVNLLALRSNFADDPPFTTCIDRLRETSLAAFEHQDLPFEKLIEELRLRRDTSRNPLFQVALALQNAPRTTLTATGIAIFPLPFEIRTTRFDIEMHLAEEASGKLHGITYFDHDLFDSTTIQRWQRAWARLLEAAVAEPGLRASALPLLSVAELTQLLIETNDTARPLPAGALVHRLFAARARRQPAALAAAGSDFAPGSDFAISYSALEQRANALAHHLRSLGVGPDVLVALHLRRGASFLWAILGVLKAGGAYLPLDPSHPQQRLRFLLDDAAPRVVLSDGALPAGLMGDGRQGLDLAAWVVQDGGQGPPYGVLVPPDVVVDGENLAYVIYTSGSTGKPKGVEVRHRGLSNLAAWWRAHFDLQPGERSGQVSTTAFDAAVMEIWPCLTAGGSLHFAPDTARSSAAEMLAWMAGEKIQHCWLPTPLVELAGGETWPAELRLKALQTGGDKLHGRVLQNLPAALWECFCNLYGPTEITVLATSSPVRDGIDSPPVGRPIDNHQVYLFDRHLRPVARGARGEIHLGGAGLARGYRWRPGQTAERFVPHPLASGEPGARLYRTGDLGRMSADGEIEFLGRVDQQVKVRGYRIELGEVEAALTRHQSVRAAVVARHPADHEQRLVAYVVPNTEAQNTALGEAPQDQVDAWQLVFDDLYARPAPHSDAALNTIGWDDTASGTPLGEEAMRQWLEDTLRRIRALAARRVLEIGCGTGMILFPIAPTCLAYFGTDISQQALDYIEAQRSAFGGLPQVELLQRAAHEDCAVPPGSIDLVILNSVAQYFPSAAYLGEVIENAFRVLAPGGKMFLGDIRSRPLAAGFHATVELARAAEDDLVAEVAQRARLDLLEEAELIVDPAFFFRLQGHLPGLDRVEILVKRGTVHNELISFRYQVLLHVVGPEQANVEKASPGNSHLPTWLDWQRDRLSLGALRHRLAVPQTPDAWAIGGLPNARLSRALEVFDPAAERLTAGALRRRQAEGPPEGVEPQELWDLGEELGWDVELSWARHDASGAFDLLLRRRGTNAAFPQPPPPDFAREQPLAHFTNRPGLAHRLVAGLRQDLAAQLPEYMLPTAWMLLPEIPLTDRGKVDHRALPAPGGGSTSSRTHYVAATTAMEQALQEIWQELLDLPRIGIHDDFFALGGHSLLATQVLSRIRQAFEVELPLRTLFEAPTIAGLGEHLTQRRTAQPSADDLPAITRGREGDDLPLSFAQERLWFLDHLVPDNPFYNSPMFWTLRGPLKVQTWAASLGEIVRRHEVLRTSFPARDGQPVQVIAPCAGGHCAGRNRAGDHCTGGQEPCRLMVPRIDLQALAEAARRAEAERLAKAEARRPFDLENGPILRATLVHLAAEETLFLLTLHHIATDGWSFRVLLNELETLYQSFLAGHSSPLPALPVQYADYARWQRAGLQGPRLEELLTYWTSQLAGASTLELPTDHPRRTLPTFRGRHQDVHLTAELSTRLQALSQGAGTTLFMTLFAAWSAFLHRLTGEKDLVVGTPIAGRNRAETEALIGFFINSLALRADLSANPTFTTFLAQMRDTSLAAFDHQDLPFEKLVEEFRPQRDTRRNPIFQVLMVLQNAPQGPLAAASLDLEPYVVELRTARFDLELSLTEEPSGLRGVLGFDADLFDATTIQRWRGHWQVLLEALVSSGATRVADLPLLAAAQRAQLVLENNDACRAFPQAQAGTLDQIFAAAAEHFPECLAVTLAGAHLSYATLQAKTLRLAAELRGRGVGPEVVVAIAMERSFEMLIALLAVLTSGGAYLPLDPKMPSRRRDQVLEESAAAWVLTRREEDEAGHGMTPPRLALDSRGAVVGAPTAAQTAAPKASDRPPVASSNLAYVIYTSGSSGRPKGVMIPHGGIVNTLLWRLDEFALGPDDTILQNIAFTFDPSLWQIFGALFSGGRLVLVPAAKERDFRHQAHRLLAERVTITDLAPSMLDVFLEQPEVAEARSLRLLFAGGEAMPPPLRDRFLATVVADLRNIYGPTEASIDAACRRCRQGGGAPVPIGRPIANKRLFVLDADLRLQPSGVPGELLIAGQGLARGYLGQPARSAESFLPHPFATTPGARLYRTGDRVRRRADGALEFLSRLDRQIKLRGFRIELGDVEAALLRSPAVHEAVAVVRAAGPGEPQLVGYFVVGPPALLDDSSGDLDSDFRGAFSAASLRHFIAEQLPAYMVPASLVRLPSLPRTASGKIDLKALPAPPSPLEGQLNQPPRGALERNIADIWCELLGLERVGRDEGFFDLGGTSLSILRVQSRLEKKLGRPIPVVDFFQFPSLRSLAHHLDPAADLGEDEAQPVVEQARSRAAGQRAERAGASANTEHIAILSMVGRFPRAPNVDTLWRNLCAGVSGIEFFSDDELRAAGVAQDLLNHAQYVRAGTVIKGVELFDAELFNVPPHEAELLDPQHRLFLEACWQALQEAGYDPERYPGAVGVYAGASANSYLPNHLLANGEVMQAAGVAQTMLANDRDFLATRVSFKLNLRGPSLTVQTACSTSLVAIHLAAEALARGQCDLALAGGVSLHLPQKQGYLYRQGGVLSPDGHCRAFDSEAGGTVAGCGLGVVLLKRLDQALADGDEIRAVVHATAINNDGAQKVGYTAPSAAGQAAAIATAQALAGVRPEEIGYIEAHGTGTPLGDPIEVAALRQVFGGPRQDANTLIGSIKTSIGHLDAAAGVAGLIKAALTVETGNIPASLHCTAPNPRLELAKSPLRIATEFGPWPLEGPRRAAVSSFGIGGTNAHAILGQAPVQSPSGPSRDWQIVAFSARAEASATDFGVRLGQHFEETAEMFTSPPAFADAAYTLLVGHRAFAHRRALVCRNAAEAAAALQTAPGGSKEGGWTSFVDPRRSAPPPVFFLFPGQGAQQVGMAAGIYHREPVFREALDRAAELARDHLGLDLRELLLASPDRQTEAGERLTDTALAQPALFVVEYALVQLWRSWGVVPGGSLGHSLGEYVAAWVAGVFDLETALRLVIARGRLMQGLPPGAMLAVPLDPEELAQHLGAELSIAAHNAPGRTVVSGPPAAVEALEKRLASLGIAHRRLVTSHAFHSSMLDEILPDFATVLRQVTLRPPAQPYVSNVTGTWISAAEATDPDYWLRHLRQPVRFAAGLETLLAEPGAVLLEVGPGQGLSALARRVAAARAGESERPLILPSLGPAQAEDDDQAVLLSAFARLWLAGVAVDEAAFYGGERRHRTRLPICAFERQRYWVEPNSTTASDGAVERRAESPQVLNLTDSFWAPAWREAPLPAHQASPAPPGAVLLFADRRGLGADLAKGLRDSGEQVIEVVQGAAFKPPGVDGRWTLRPGHREDYERLEEALDPRPGRIVHLWNLDPVENTEGSVDHAIEVAFYSLLFLAQTVLQPPLNSPAPLELSVLSENLHALPGDETVAPLRALLLGVTQVLPQENRATRCRSIDLRVPPAGHARRRLVEQLVAELERPANEPLIAWRGGRRWAQDFVAAPIHQPTMDDSTTLPEGGVYLITGGLGGVGLALARGLAQRSRGTRLALLGRSPPPEEKLAAIRDLENSAAEVLVLRADVADRQAMTTAVQAVRQRWGHLDGVVHAAGVPGGGLIALKEPTAAAAVLSPKVGGTLVLAAVVAEVFAEAPPRWMVLCSSLAAFLGGVGQVDYAAANAFLEAWASAHSTEDSRVLAIAWDTWREAGMAFESTQRDHGEQPAWGLLSAEGVEAFFRALASGRSQTLVSSRNFAALAAAHREPGAAPLEPPKLAPGPAAKRYARPDLTTPYAAPRNATEERVATIFQEILGLEQVGIDDLFTDLGGDSLLAAQVLARLRDAFQVELPLKALFNNPTVERLALQLVEEETRGAEPEDLAAMLADLDGLSDEEVEALLAADPGTSLGDAP